MHACMHVCMLQTHCSACACDACRTLFETKILAQYDSLLSGHFKITSHMPASRVLNENANGQKERGQQTAA